MGKMAAYVFVIIASFSDSVIKGIFREREYLVIDDMTEREEKWMANIGKRFLKKVGQIPEGNQRRAHNLNNLLSNISDSPVISTNNKGLGNVKQMAADIIEEAKAEARKILDEAREQVSTILSEAIPETELEEETPPPKNPGMARGKKK